MNRLTVRLICVLLTLAILLSGACAAAAEEDYEPFSAGARGQNVKRLQRRLKQLGYYSDRLDGDYGFRTLYAVSGFQSRSGLPVTGAADRDTLIAVYSAAAKPVPGKVPAVEITRCAMDGPLITVSFRNNTADAVDRILFHVCAYDETGRPLALISGPASVGAGIPGPWTYDAAPLRPGASVTTDVDPGASWSEDVRSVSVFVAEYHTAPGVTYRYGPDQLWLVHNGDHGGYMEYPSDDLAPASLPDEPLSQAQGLLSGVSRIDIYPQMRNAYSLPAGCLMTVVAENSPFFRAGLRAGDVILSLDDTSALAAFSLENACLRLLNDEPVTVRLFRDGAEITVSCAPEGFGD